MIEQHKSKIEKLESRLLKVDPEAKIAQEIEQISSKEVSITF